MELKEQQKRSEKLVKLIKDLAVSQTVFSDKGKYNEFYTRLRGIYLSETEHNFRHLYNDIFSVISEIDNVNEASVDILGENIRLLYEYCLTKKQ